MKTLHIPCLSVVWLLVLAGSSVGADFIVDSVAIRKAPLKAPYYLHFEVSYGDKRAAMSEPKKMDAPAMEGREILVPLNLKLVDVLMRAWATVTIRIDPDLNKVKTHEAAYEHTARIPMVSNATKPQIIMPRQGLGEYVVRSHGQN